MPGLWQLCFEDWLADGDHAIRCRDPAHLRRNVSRWEVALREAGLWDNHGMEAQTVPPLAPSAHALPLLTLALAALPSQAGALASECLQPQAGRLHSGPDQSRRGCQNQRDWLWPVAAGAAVDNMFVTDHGHFPG